MSDDPQARLERIREQISERLQGYIDQPLTPAAMANLQETIRAIVEECVMPLEPVVAVRLTGKDRLLAGIHLILPFDLLDDGLTS